MSLYFCAVVYQGLALYRKMGYIPCDLVEESASKALDYSYDDWAAARIARAAGAEDDARLLAERSKNYRNLFDRKTCFMRPRLQNGEWAAPFDPKEISIMKKWRDFTESNAWQATFANQHDLKGYIELFGGREAFVAQLDALFAQSTDLPPDTPPDVAGLVGMYAHGNEPSHHIAYLYCYAGAPWKTQERVRSLLETMYHDDPDGVAGNEDCGQISAWYVISAPESRCCSVGFSSLWNRASGYSATPAINWRIPTNMSGGIVSTPNRTAR